MTTASDNARRQSPGQTAPVSVAVLGWISVPLVFVSPLSFVLAMFLVVGAGLQAASSSVRRSRRPSRAGRALPARRSSSTRCGRIGMAQMQERRSRGLDRRRPRLHTSIGMPLEPRNVLRSFHALCHRAQVRRVRIHDLRHAAASFVLLQGVDVHVVMGTLGHLRLATTSDLYTHLLDPVQRAAADRMDDLLRRVAPPSGG